MSAMLARNGSQALAAKSVRSQGAARVRVVSCRAEVPVKAERKAVMNPILGSSKSAQVYLNGTLPGDFGFDPLGLMDPNNSGGFVNPEWLSYSEVIHCRWAMLGAAGCIAPEILGKMGSIPEATNVLWFKSGVIPPAGSYNEYWTDSMSLFLIEVVAMQFAELKRWQDFKYPGSQAKQYFLGLETAFAGSGNPSYPGGQWFNMCNFGKTEAEMTKLKTNELRNGRLAMLAMFGYGAQAIITREGPFENLCKHLSAPTENNIIGSFGHVFGQ